MVCRNLNNSRAVLGKVGILTLTGEEGIHTWNSIKECINRCTGGRDLSEIMSRKALNNHSLTFIRQDHKYYCKT